MKTLQIVLNAILSKNIFEYILVDSELKVIESSIGVENYFEKRPEVGEDILDYIPEFVGNEDEIKKVFVKKYCLFSLETVNKNGYYLNISIEYCDSKTAIILLHNVTAITVNQQHLLQYSNESALLSSTLNKVIDNQNSMVFVTNKHHIEFANKKFLDYFGIEHKDDLKTKDLQIYKYIDRDFASYDQLYKYISVHKDENYVRLKNNTFLIQASKIEHIHNLFTLIDITDITSKLEKDPLTDIYRKNYLNDIALNLINKQERFALIVLDLDDFKKINDTYGHQVGDKVLQDFVNLVKKYIRKDDIFARWGGEEFLLLMRDTTPKDVKRRIEYIRKKVDKHLFDTVEHITCSFGIACANKEDDMESLLYRADKALYEAKEKGKNKVVYKKA